MDQSYIMLKKQYSSFFLALVMICITRTVFAVEVKTSLGLIPTPDIPGIPKEGNDYSKLLAYSLYFYEAQRSGALPPDNRVSWRHNSALDDGKDRGVNLSGGYYDAGDYVKFTLPLSWTLSVISWGAIEWFDGYQLSNQTGYLHDMIKWGTDWLIESHTKPDQLFIQVGSIHGTDTAAETAAAFASSAILFRDFFNDTAYANTLMAHAINIYSFAETPNLTLSTITSNGIYGYSTSEFYDKLVWGALWLYRLTYQSQYLDKAINYYNLYKNKSHATRVMTWDDHIGACNILFAQTFSDKSNANSTHWSNVTESYLDDLITDNKTCNYTNGGLLWCVSDSPQDSIPISLYGSFGFLMYSSYASTTEKATKYRNFVASQLNYLFGDNPMKMFYIVAVHPNSPKNPHHAGASGGIDVGNLSDPAVTKYPLYGAVVAIDYNSAFQGIMAYYVMDTYVPPDQLPNGSKNPENPDANSISTFQNLKTIIIIVACSVFILLLVLSMIVYKYKKTALCTRNNQEKLSDLEKNNKEKHQKKLKDLEENNPKELGDLEENNLKEPGTLEVLEENNQKESSDVEKNNSKEPSDVEEKSQNEPSNFKENKQKEPNDIEENNQKESNDLEENEELRDLEKNNQKTPNDLEESKQKISSDLEENNQKEPDDLEENNHKIPSDLEKNNQKEPNNLEENNQKISSDLEGSNQKMPSDLRENNQKESNSLEENNQKESNSLEKNNQKESSDPEENNQKIPSDLEENN
ncbi:5261_t:CDS:2 [Dentiscutata heterogama]|uniref:5261_t:CDS:1 n=1 Tax=Dentiscutata heterogama TaxID=1316150 RepID=A0ACA9LJR7_9GLOM|nr:5261_t:CDS:2 [Dentiscutata heterogama]